MVITRNVIGVEISRSDADRLQFQLCGQYGESCNINGTLYSTQRRVPTNFIALRSRLVLVLVFYHWLESGPGATFAQLLFSSTIMDKSLGTLLRFWGVFQCTQFQPLPSPHKQCWTRVSRIFFRVSTLHRVGGERSARKFRTWCTVLRVYGEVTEKYASCSRVPRTFVQDCLNPGVGEKSMFSLFFLRFFRYFGDM